MMNRLLPATLLAALLPAAMTVNANDSDGLSPWYIGAGVGVNDYEHNYSIRENIDDDPAAWEGFVGYQVSDIFAFELGYRNLGYGTWTDWAKSNHNDAGAKGIALGLVGTIPLYKDFHALAEAGAMHYTLKNNRNWGTNHLSDSGWAPYFGAGLGYFITDNIQLAVKYRRYSDLEENTYKSADLDSNYWGATVSYRFGTASKPAPAPIPVIEEVVITDADQDGVPDNIDQCENSPAQFMVDASGCTVYEERIQNLRIDAKFANNSSVLNKISMDEVAILADFMQQNPKSSVIIKGFASNVGNPDYNMQLSQRRAEAVAKALATQFGINTNRISAKGYGITQPLIPGNSREANQANRRIEAEVTVIEMVATSR